MGAQWAEKQLGPLRDQLGWRKQAAGARYGDEGGRVSERLDLIELWRRARENVSSYTCLWFDILNTIGFVLNSPSWLEIVKIEVNRRSQEIGSKQMK